MRWVLDNASIPAVKSKNWGEGPMRCNGKEKKDGATRINRQGGKALEKNGCEPVKRSWGGGKEGGGGAEKRWDLKRSRVQGAGEEKSAGGK